VSGPVTGCCRVQRGTRCGCSRGARCDGRFSFPRARGSSPGHWACPCSGRRRYSPSSPAGTPRSRCWRTSASCRRARLRPARTRRPSSRWPLTSAAREGGGRSTRPGGPEGVRCERRSRAPSAARPWASAHAQSRGHGPPATCLAPENVGFLLLSSPLLSSLSSRGRGSTRAGRWRARGLHVPPPDPRASRSEATEAGSGTADPAATCGPRRIRAFLFLTIATCGKRSTGLRAGWWTSEPPPRPSPIARRGKGPPVPAVPPDRDRAFSGRSQLYSLRWEALVRSFNRDSAAWKAARAPPSERSGLSVALRASFFRPLRAPLSPVPLSPNAQAAS
jgi:hypothetical protein